MLQLSKKQQESDGLGRPSPVSCNHLEQLVDELNPAAVTLNSAQRQALAVDPLDGDGDQVSGLAGVAAAAQPPDLAGDAALLFGHRVTCPSLIPKPAG